MTTPPPPPSSSSAPDAVLPRAGAPGPNGSTLPSAGKRIGVRLIDVLVVVFVFGSIVTAVIAAGDPDLTVADFQNEASTGQLLLAGLLVATFGFVWEAVSTWWFGGSPMKLLFGLRVVQAGSGADVGLRHAVVRWAVPGAFGLVPIGLLGSLATLVVAAVSLAFLFTRPMREAVWDLAAKTIVVDR